MAEAVATADLVVSLVTADQAVVAAEAAAPHVAGGALYVDGNSCSPQRKRAAAERIEAAGGRYVDMAIMAPVHPLRQRVPVLLSGPHAKAALARLESLGMRPVIAGPEIGQASTIKMMRSIMVKGFEALTAECMLAARRAGVEEAVLASLQASDPEIDWPTKAAYYLERMMVHGRRRAAEMREVAQTVADLGLPDRLSSAIAAWQEEIGNLQIDGREEKVGASAERILAAMAEPKDRAL
jgi:3-hydroxyisobutyrate dehydrogenase-like beta-hydroxyacid dehydrogenase